MNLVTKTGYYRPTPSSIQFLKCFNHQACRGGPVHTQCQPGYLGPFCQYCDNQYTRTFLHINNTTNNNHYGSIAPYVCRDCKSWQLKLKVSMSILIKVLWLTFYLFYSVKMSVSGEQVGRFCLLKILMIHFQLMQLFITQLPLEYSSDQLLMIHLLTANLCQLLPLECYQLLISQLPLYIAQLLLIVMMPVILLVVVVVVLLVTRVKVQFNRIIPLVAVTLLQIHCLDIMYYLLPCLFKVSLSSMSVVSLPHMLYSSHSHNTLLLYLVIPALFLYCFLFPLFVFITNRRISYQQQEQQQQQQEQEQSKVQLVMSQFYLPYRVGVYQWDVIVWLGQLGVLITVLGLFKQLREGQQYPVVVLFIELVVLLFICQSVSPFETSRLNYLNQLQCQSLQVLLLTLYVLFYEMLLPSGSSPFISPLVRCLALLFNLYFLLKVVRLFTCNTLHQYLSPIYNRPLQPLNSMQTIFTQPDSNNNIINTDHLYLTQQDYLSEQQEQLFCSVQPTVQDEHTRLPEQQQLHRYKDYRLTFNHLQQCNKHFRTAVATNETLRMALHQSLTLKQKRVNQLQQTFHYRQHTVAGGEHLLELNGERGEHLLELNGERGEHLLELNGERGEHLLELNGERGEHLLELNGERGEHLLELNEEQQSGEQTQQMKSFKVENDPPLPYLYID